MCQPRERGILRLAPSRDLHLFRYTGGLGIPMSSGSRVECIHGDSQSVDGGRMALTDIFVVNNNNKNSNNNNNNNKNNNNNSNNNNIIWQNIR